MGAATSTLRPTATKARSFFERFFIRSVIVPVALEKAEERPKGEVVFLKEEPDLASIGPIPSRFSSSLELAITPPECGRAGTPGYSSRLINPVRIP
jgi:hypothetical protein